MDISNVDRNEAEDGDAGDVGDVRRNQRCFNGGTLGHFERGCRLKGKGKGTGKGRDGGKTQGKGKSKAA